MTIEIYPEDFVVFVSGDLSLGDLDQKLSQQGMVSFLEGPKNYSINQILLENRGDYCHKSCLGLTVRHKDGTVTKTGARVIKNVSGYDLSKLYIGSKGDFVQIETAFLRVDKLAEAQLELVYSDDSLAEDFLQFDFMQHWDNSSVNLICDIKNNADSDLGQGSTPNQGQLKIKIWGDKDLLELRSNKIQACLGMPKQALEKVFVKEYDDTELHLEIYSKASELCSLILDLLRLCATTPQLFNSLSVDILKSKISLVCLKPSLFAADDCIERDRFVQELINLNKHDRFYAHVYPCTNISRNLEAILNANNINKFESDTYSKIAEILA